MVGVGGVGVGRVGVVGVGGGRDACQRFTLRGIRPHRNVCAIQTTPQRLSIHV